MMSVVKKVLTCGALVVAGALLAYPVYAHCGKCAADGKKIVTLMDQNKVTIAKFVQSAEQHSKGRAIAVLSELNDSDQLQPEVYCMVGDKIMKCQLDGKTASVSDMKEVKQFPITEDESDHDHGSGDKPQASAKTITNQLVDVGCGSCVYHMTGVQGCELAVKIDGQSYLVTGANVDAHQFCTAAKKALVSGRVEGNRFIATKFEVQSS